MVCSVRVMSFNVRGASHRRDGVNVWEQRTAMNVETIRRYGPPQKLGDGCWSLSIGDPVEGRSSVTVTNLEGMPRGGPPAGTTTFNPKTIRGPWTFEFEVPETPGP